MRAERRLVLCVAIAILVGTVARVVTAFATFGVGFDIETFQIVAHAVRASGAGVYDTGRWLYPPGYLPVLGAADAVAEATGLPFHGVVQLPPIAADAGLAVLVAAILRRTGASDRTVLAGAALVALGPSFAFVSGFHGQIDAVAILPAVAGVLLWVRDAPRRALWAGLLIGVGAAVKSLPLFCVLPLLPSARSRREAFTLVAAAVAVPLLALAPFLLSDAGTVVASLRENRGVPGFGGLSALLQPSLARWWATFGPVPALSPLVSSISSVQNVIVGVAALLAAALAARRRAPPLDGLALLWMTVLVVNPNPSYQYLVWGLPFLAAAGRLRACALVQLAFLVPSVLIYFRPGIDGSGWVYFATAELGWAVLAAVWVGELRRRYDAARAIP